MKRIASPSILALVPASAGLVETPNPRLIVVDSALVILIKESDIPDQSAFLACIQQHAAHIS